MTRVVYEKEWTSVEQQIERLESRGLVVEDREQLAHAIQAIGCYRLTGYTYPFRTSSGGVVEDTFREGTRQSQVLALYDFDRRLKLTVMDAIERMEIGFRFSVAYTLGKRDRYGHLHRSSLDRSFTRRQVAGGAYWRVALVGSGSPACW
ncbi:MAG: Abi family protein [Candidatus Nanopelagicales bacterium]|nr:Abi family protein [Candidatus Nanopelagicales bacterium]